MQAPAKDLQNHLQHITTLPELFQYRCQATPTTEAYRWFDVPSNQWQSFS